MAESFYGYDGPPVVCGDAHSWWWEPSLCPVCHPGPGTPKQEPSKAFAEQNRALTAQMAASLMGSRGLDQARRAAPMPSDDPYLRRWGLS